MNFNLKADFSPAGDQPFAIKEICQSFYEGASRQILMGVTGSGKTYTVSNIIKNLNLPTLVLTHNKTLAAQLYEEFKKFFPENDVGYFVSYYDYYQPEAYIVHESKYIEKDARINAEIERLRNQLKKYEESVDCFDKSLTLDSKNPVVWELKGITLEQLGRDDEADQCFAKAKELEEE